MPTYVKIVGEKGLVCTQNKEIYQISAIKQGKRKDEYDEIKKLLFDYCLHRIEWRMVGGNPVEKSYDKLCKKFNGTNHILRDSIKDKYGKYRDDIIYEIINDK